MTIWLKVKSLGSWFREVRGSVEKREKKLQENFFSLSALQFTNYVLPLVTLPYLTRVLGMERFGLIAFAQTTIAYFLVVTDFGFNLSATREISINRNKKEKIEEIFSSVLIIKFVLMFFSLLLLTGLVLAFERFRAEWLVYYLAFGMVVGQTLFPVWFFQGMENMKYITYLNLVAKTIFTLSIFVFIRDPSHYLYVPLIQSLGFICAGIIALWLIYRNFSCRMRLFSFRVVRKYFIDSSQFFLSRASASIYTTSNTFVLGLFTSNLLVGYYVLAEKIYFALKLVYNPVADVLYPYIASTRNVRLFKKIFKLTNLLNLAALAVALFFVNDIVRLVAGYQSEQINRLVYAFMVICLFRVPSTLLGFPLLGGLGHAHLVNRSAIQASVLHLALLVILSFFSLISIYTVVGAVFLTELFVFAQRVYFTWQLRVFENENL